MTMKRKSPVAVKVIACLLLLGSLACVLLPWMKLSADVKIGGEESRMSPGEILREFGMDTGAVLDLVDGELDQSGLSQQRTNVRDLLTRVLDGHFTLPDLAVLCRELGEVSDAAQRPDVGRTLSTAGIAVWAAVGLLAALGLVALICQLTDHRWGILPYLLLGIGITAGLYLLRAELNRALVQESDALFSELGIGGLGILGIQIDLAMVKMGIGALLCPFLALLALLLMGIRQRPQEPVRQISPYPARRAPGAPTAQAARPASAAQAARPAEGWTCPNCGHVCDATGNFCRLCGTERPRLPSLTVCQACGRQIPRDSAFCSECGAPLPTRTPEPGFRLPEDDRY